MDLLTRHYSLPFCFFGFAHVRGTLLGEKGPDLRDVFFSCISFETYSDADSSKVSIGTFTGCLEGLRTLFPKISHQAPDCRIQVT